MNTTEKKFKKKKTKENLRTTAAKISKLSEPINTSTEVSIMTTISSHHEKDYLIDKLCLVCAVIGILEQYF
jgi:hypothetical protein